MKQLNKKKSSTRNVAATLLIVVSATAIAAETGPNGEIMIAGSALESSGGAWFPDIPAASWGGFDLVLPGGTIYLDSSASVLATLEASVIDPVALGVTYPKNRLPDVVYTIDGAGDQLDQSMTILWPNVQDYPAGETHLVYVYDEASATWSVSGAATVGSDGASLVQPDVTHNTAVTYYFVDQNVLLTLPSGS